MKRSQSKSQNLTDRIVSGFNEFRDNLKKDDDIQKHHTVRRVMLDLNPIPYSPEQVKATRNILGISQPLFARFLGVRPSTLKAWEQGRNVPPDMACRFMDEIRLNPKYWRKRVSQILVSRA